MILTSTQTQLQKEAVKFLSDLVKKGGPEPHEYQAFTDIVNHLKPDQVDPFREVIKPSLNENTLIGHGFVKPYGYPGDFHLIHNIYTQKANPNPKFKSWDDFFLNQPAAQAVRNRKDFFLRSCKRLEESDFNLLDFDQNAIDFAKAQNEFSNGSIEYFRINVLRYKPYKYYDLIWSAGLFDYFKEKHFIYLINKYYKNLADNGEFIVGNFSHLNPTKRLMEVLSDWYLNHRSRYDLIRMAVEAEVNEDRVIIENEELGINMFMRIKNARNGSG